MCHKASLSLCEPLRVCLPKKSLVWCSYSIVLGVSRWVCTPWLTKTSCGNWLCSLPLTELLSPLFCLSFPRLCVSQMKGCDEPIQLPGCDYKRQIKGTFHWWQLTVPPLHTKDSLLHSYSYLTIDFKIITNFRFSFSIPDNQCPCK